MKNNCTHTFAEMEVSEATFNEIREKLLDAGYDHLFTQREPKGGAIDMHGIGLVREPKRHCDEKLSVHGFPI